MTSHDIAREAEVSHATVSRALRDDPRVLPKTGEAVRAAAQRLGYVPDAAARTLITRRWNRRDRRLRPQQPLLPGAGRGALPRARREGLPAVLSGENSADPEGGLAELLRSGLVDGAILATARDNEATRALLRGDEAPIVQFPCQLQLGGLGVDRAHLARARRHRA